ncbi:MAG: YceI family protein [Bacteroidales bacterium]|nr:YceI family protein [Bacteroidales bacterium]
MKKPIKTLLIITFGLIIASCGGPGGDKATAGDAATAADSANATMYVVNTNNSHLEWEGYKPTGTHHGHISIASGILGILNGNIISGSFIIDMKSIVNEDLTDEAYNQKLIGHLMSTDFFAVDSFPEAFFNITSVIPLTSPETSSNGDTLTHLISGNLKIKGIEKNIQFKSGILIKDNQVLVLVPQFTIDRAEWKIKYASRKFFDNLKDKFVNDEIGIKINLIATHKMY